MHIAAVSKQFCEKVANCELSVCIFISIYRKIVRFLSSPLTHTHTLRVSVT